jgi:hypothetical protein
MAEIKTPQKAIPFAGLIYSKGFDSEKALTRIEKDLGSIALKSDVIQFKHTHYYDKEMGEKLQRQWCVFDKLVIPDALVGLKHTSNLIETKYLNEKGGRQINIDPGLLSLSNVILASTKNYSHRIYIGNGIYAEVTLIYRNKQYYPLEWTYPDYQEKTVLQFFLKVREFFKQNIIQSTGKNDV